MGLNLRKSQSAYISLGAVAESGEMEKTIVCNFLS